MYNNHACFPFRHFTVQGWMTLPVDTCGPDGTIFISVHVNASTDGGETVLTNNMKRVPYACSPGRFPGIHLLTVFSKSTKLVWYWVCF